MSDHYLLDDEDDMRVLELVTELVRSGDDHGYFALTSALRDYAPERLQEDLEEPNVYGWTPLMVAAEVGEFRLMQVLLDFGADLERAVTSGHLKSDLGKTAMHFAAGKHQRHLAVRVLLEAGGQVNVRSGSGLTPLLLAVDYQAWDSARLLIEAGALDADGEALESAQRSTDSAAQEIASLLLARRLDASLPPAGAPGTGRGQL